MGKLVIESLETSDGARCVDIFQRADLSYGFEIYRRDPEALIGWFPVGNFANKRFPSEAAARESALKYAPWIA